MLRHRSNTFGQGTGTWSSLTTGGGSRSYFTFQGVIDDNVLPGEGHDLDIIKVWNDGTFRYTGNAANSSPSQQRKVFDFPLSGFVPGSSGEALHLSFPSKPSNGALAAQLLADTNPSRSVVDLPIFIAELREVPDLIKSAGDSIIRKIASGNLKYQFGLRPLINDLKSLLDFQQHVADREKELAALAKSGLRRKRELWSDSDVEVVTNRTINSIPTWMLVRATRTRSTTCRSWGFVKYFPNENVPTTASEIHDAAKRAVFGLTIDPVTAWELIPWSWLIDWCSSTGDFLQSRRNLIGCTHSVPQIMHYTRTESTFQITKDATQLVSATPTMIRENKQRRSASASISAYLPALNARRLSILGSISVLRSTKR